MDKLQKLADRLQASIDFATEQKEDFEASSWNYQEGVLLNHNEAKLVVNLVENLAIHIVSKRFLFEGQDLTNNQPFKKVIDAENRESAIADMEVTYPELKWVMTTEV